jgi:hypothetical protein
MGLALLVRAAGHFDNGTAPILLALRLVVCMKLSANCR